MKNKIVIAILALFVLILLILELISVLGSKADIGKTDAMYENISISFNQYLINFEEEIYFKKDGHLNMISIPLQITSFNRDSIKVYIDDVEIDYIGNPSSNDVKFKNYNNGLSFYRLDTINDGVHKITAKYSIATELFVKEYTDRDVIDIKYTNYVPYEKIKITLPESTSKFDTSVTQITYEKQSENVYILNTKELNKDLKIFVDNGLIPNAGKTGKKYEKSFEELKEIKIDKYVKDVNLLIILLTALNLIIVYFITRIKRTEKNYNRETDNLIDPVFAEAVVDRKVDAKDLIMAVIVEQISKNNILIENDKLTLVKLDTKSSIKQHIINIFFDREGETINIKDISHVFRDETIIDDIIELFKNIKKKIIKILYSSEIYDIKKRKKLKCFRWLSIVFIIEAILYYIYLLFGYVFVLKATIGLSIILALVYILLKRTKLIQTFSVFLIPVLYFAAVIFGLLVISFLPNKAQTVNIVESIFLLLSIICNIVIIVLSRKHVFTEKGLIEYKKIKGLYDYLIDYSLMKERDINSVVLWDKYLVYATAFGIPSKVTSRFAEELMNVADILNKINSIILTE